MPLIRRSRVDNYLAPVLTRSPRDLPAPIEAPKITVVVGGWGRQEPLRACLLASHRHPWVYARFIRKLARTP